jgi:hypothetical protein
MEANHCLRPWHTARFDYVTDLLEAPHKTYLSFTQRDLRFAKLSADAQQAQLQNDTAAAERAFQASEFATAAAAWGRVLLATPPDIAARCPLDVKIGMALHRADNVKGVNAALHLLLTHFKREAPLQVLVPAFAQLAGFALADWWARCEEQPASKLPAEAFKEIHQYLGQSLSTYVNSVLCSKTLPPELRTAFESLLEPVVEPLITAFTMIIKDTPIARRKVECSRYLRSFLSLRLDVKADHAPDVFCRTAIEMGLLLLGRAERRTNKSASETPHWLDPAAFVHYDGAELSRQLTLLVPPQHRALFEQRFLSFFNMTLEASRHRSLRTLDMAKRTYPAKYQSFPHFVLFGAIRRSITLHRQKAHCDASGSDEEEYKRANMLLSQVVWQRNHPELQSWDTRLSEEDRIKVEEAKIANDLIESAWGEYVCAHPLRDDE